MSLDKTMAIMESLEAGKIDVKNLSSAAGSLNAICQKQKNNINNVKYANTAISSRSGVMAETRKPVKKPYRNFGLFAHGSALEDGRKNCLAFNAKCSRCFKVVTSWDNPSPRGFQQTGD